MGASPVHSQRRLIVAPAEPAAADKTCIALSFNGRTSDSDSLDRGSNPWGATNTISAAVAVTGFESLGLPWTYFGDHGSPAELIQAAMF